MSKSTSVREYHLWDGDNMSWEISLRRVLRQSELVEYKSLSSLLSNFFFYERTSLTLIFESQILQVISPQSLYTRSWTRSVRVVVMCLSLDGSYSWSGGFLLIGSGKQDLNSK